LQKNNYFEIANCPSEQFLTAPTSRRLNVVVRSPPLYPRGGPKWRDNYPEESNHLVAPQSSGTQNPAFNFKKAHWDEFEEYISEHPPLPIEEVQNIHCAARSFSSLLLNAAKASISFHRLSHSPKAWWSEEAELAVQDRRRAYSEAHHLAYVEASWRVSSVISRAKTETWQATCNNLSPRSNPRVVFNLLNTVAGKKGSSRDPELTSNPLKILPTSTLPTSAHTSLNKLPGFLAALSVTS